MPSQPSIARQVPPEQYWPSGHWTPAHGTRKQPATQRPSTHVCPASQLTFVHASPVGTQSARQVVSSPHIDID
jgi:hypothetical protein